MPPKRAATAKKTATTQSTSVAGQSSVTHETQVTPRNNTDHATQTLLVDHEEEDSPDEEFTGVEEDKESVEEVSDDDEDSERIETAKPSANSTKIPARPRRRPKLWKDAGLTFPCARFYRKLQKGNYAKKIKKDAPVYLTSAIEYLVAEVLEGASEETLANGKRIITPRFLMSSIKKDAEVDQLLKDVIIAGSGVVPHIEPSLLPKPKAGKRKAEANESGAEKRRRLSVEDQPGTSKNVAKKATKGTKRVGETSAVVAKAAEEENQSSSDFDSD